MKWVVVRNGSKWHLLIYLFCFCPRTMGKYGLTCTWKCKFYQKKKIAKAIELNIWAVLIKFKLWKNKNLFSSRKILNSLPGFTVDNNAGWFLLGCKMEGCQRSEILLGILDLIVRWVCFPGQRTGGKLHCGRRVVRVCIYACLCVCKKWICEWTKWTMKQILPVSNYMQIK